MPFQNHTKYRQQMQNKGTELHYASSVPISEENLDLERKIDTITTYQKPYTKKILIVMARANPHNALTVFNYIVAQKNELNIKESTVEGIIKKLAWLSSYLGHKPFSEMTKGDILHYLNSIKKPPELDPTHKSIGTYNGRQMAFSTFFRWLYNQDEPDCRKRITPPCMNGVRRLPRQETSPYKPSDLWTGEEHEMFLKYCPNKRDRCYHVMANDTSARPHELLKLRIKDIIFKRGDSGLQYAEIQVSGKTRPRTLPLINSIPYLKEWLQEHPTSDNQDSWLFVGGSHNNYTYRISEDGVRSRYKYYYQKSYFPKLLKDETVSPRDKSYIKTMLMKPWNPYVFRHSALTEKSQILKESTLKDHAGWTDTSQMPGKYIHYFGNESSNSLLEAYGIRNSITTTMKLFRPKQCPNCSEPNKNETKFCLKCGMVLSFGAYHETLQKEEKKELEIKLMQEKYDSRLESMQDEMESKFQQILARIDATKLLE
jgi:integrase